MILFRSAHLVRELLAHERTDQLFKLPGCPHCRRPVDFITLRSFSGENALHWVCLPCYRNEEPGLVRQLPDEGGRRNPATRRGTRRRR